MGCLKLTSYQKTDLEIIYSRKSAYSCKHNHDHLGNTRVVYTPLNRQCESNTAENPFALDLNYAADYYPYGKVLREYNPKAEKYVTTHHERDTETGLDYRGARYYDSDIARFLSLDPLAMKFAEWSAYNYVVGNPVSFIDPDGRSAKWVPEKDEKGNVQYKAEKGDNLETFLKQYNLGVKEVAQIANKNGLNKSHVKSMSEGSTISGSSVKEVTGNSILKLDLKSPDLEDSDVINQVLFAMETADASKGWKTRDYFGNVDSRIINGDNTTFGNEVFTGTSTKFSPSPVSISMMFHTKEVNPMATTPGSDNSWLVPGQNNKYSFQLPTQTGASLPNKPVTIRFRGEKNMVNFTKKYDFEFSGVEK